MDDIFTSPKNTNSDHRNPKVVVFKIIVAEIANAAKKKIQTDTEHITVKYPVYSDSIVMLEAQSFPGTRFLKKNVLIDQ